MANLTLRQTKGSALTIAELDGNFEYFTGSFTNTGTITAQNFVGSFTVNTGSLTLNGGAFVNTNTQSAALTISAGYNAMLTGPIFNSSSIVVELGARLVIL